jgi:DNA helicase-2/ATP-dependent DNA helicase PcrA
LEFLDHLNPRQRQAVTAGAGPILVLAGPGSGKTRVLTQRIAYLIGHAGVRPYQMLAVTFTNKAAREMENRVAQLLGEEFKQGIQIGTFHATCARLLRREAKYLPFNDNFVIYDADDQLALIKKTIRSLDLDEKNYRPLAVHANISRAKNELIRVEKYPVSTYRDEVVKRIYSRYQEILLSSNALDFDDLLLWTVQLLENEPAVREKYAHRFMHVLVDEFQDTNQAQYLLIKHLASFHRNIFVVGDPDQSIYRWRGADYRNVQRFEQDYPEAQVILLEQNYRSRQLILDTAMAVIDQGSHRQRKQLFTDRGQGEKVFYYEAADDYGEASFVVDTIAQLVSNRRCGAGECAVMYRTNAQSRLLEEEFLRARLPYRLVGAQRFYGRREVKDVIAYLRLIHNPSDEVSLTRIINVPPRGIGEKSLLALQAAAQQVKTSPGSVLLDLAHGEASPFWGSFTGRSLIQLSIFAGLLSSWCSLQPTLMLSELFDRIMSDIEYKEHLDDGTEEGRDRWENVSELRRLAQEYDQRSLVEFLENVALVSDQDTIPESLSAPTLLTLHAAKGLEFGTVFIIGLDDGLIPHNRSFDEPEEMEEERRLFYVGITRARDLLYLVRAARRGGRGFGEYTLPSRFLDDIPSELLNGKSRTGQSFGHLAKSESRWTVPALKSTVPIIEVRFRAGMRIKHPLWGEGMVLNSRPDDGDETVEVVFESVGTKRLIASFANLTILD